MRVNPPQFERLKIVSDNSNGRIVIESPKGRLEKQKAITKQPEEMKQLRAISGGQITEMIDKNELPISKDIDWDSVSALPIFKSHKFSPVEELINQYRQLKALYDAELETESPSTRVLADIQATLIKINQSLLPYRYSKVDLVKIENPNAPSITLKLQHLTIEDELKNVTPEQE